MVVELFTSQGCSSCPPADRLLSTIGAGALGADVIPMAFHVDYWNHIGWRDPFSSAEASERQRRYGELVAGGQVYTPMLVVDGRAHVVGSIRGRVSAAIESARARKNLGWALAIERPAIAGGRVTAEIVSRRPAGGGAVELWAAIRESGLRTEVTRGENAGETLANDFIVRELHRLDGGAGRQAISIPLAESEATSRSLVVFAQDRRTMAVRAAAAVGL